AALIAVGRQSEAGSDTSLLTRGALEDNEMSAGVQRGLHAGANAFVEFGRHESAIGHFHGALSQRLALLTETGQRPGQSTAEPLAVEGVAHRHQHALLLGEVLDPFRSVLP